MSKRSMVEWGRLAFLFGSVIVLLYASQPTFKSVVAGAALVLFGECVRFWAAGHLYKTKELITSGPYRFTRNPLYLGRLFILTGVGVMAWRSDGLNLLALLIGWVIFFGYYLPRKERIEPARLESIHGEGYARYFANVPALFPRITPWGTNAANWQWDRFQRNREAFTALGLAALVVAFAIKSTALAR